MKHSKNTRKVDEDNIEIKKPVKNVKLRRIMKIVVTLLSVFTISGFAFVGYKIEKNGGGLSGILATILGEDTKQLENLEPIQVLVLGISGVDDYKLSDSIMVASYNPKTQAASLLSIPRDTYVGKANRQNATQNYIASNKINTVFRSGANTPEAINKINDLTGLNLKNYIIIDTKALVKLVDAIGGVTFDVPIDMNYDDDTQNLHIDLKAGEQRIDGAKAEQLLRFRHNNDGTTYSAEYGEQDLGRMKTQRAFVTATLKQTLKAQNIFKLTQIMDIMGQNVKTNMAVSLLKKYVPFAAKFNADDIKTGVVPGDVAMSHGVSIYIANKAKTDEVVEDLFGENGTNSLQKQISPSKTTTITTSSKNSTISSKNTTTSGSRTTKTNTTRFK